MNFKAEMNERVEQIEQILDQYLPPKEGLQKTVLTAMNTTVKAGGKRLRPMLINETYKMFGGEGDIVKPFMAAIEMIHTYSLIHDDLPALDNDDYRRGQKTCHIVYGEDMAILAGDALLNYAYEVATKAFDLADQDEMMNVVEAVKILARKPGIYGMIGGQVADVELEGTPLSMEQILFIHKNKTSALIEACMMIGAVLAGASKEDVMAMEECGEYIGLAFQIQDDILDLTGDEEEIGKPVGSDEKNHKTTYVTLKGLEQSAKDVEEMNGHFLMFNYMLDTLEEKLTENLIKQMHYELKSGVFEDRANGYAIGDYKTRPNMIGMYKTALPKDVEAEMKQLLEWYHKQEKSMKVLAEFHARYESIHPFQDGNGRTGRMILFRESLKYDELTPFIILDDNRSRYLEGLKEFREHQKVDQLLELMQKEAEIYYQECQYFIS